MNSAKLGPIISPLIYGNLEKALSVVLRLPGLFIIDIFFRNLLSERTIKIYNWNIFVSNFALVNGFLLLLLPLAHLKRYYLHFCCCTLLLTSLCLSYDWLYFDSCQEFCFFPIKQYLSEDKIRAFTAKVSNQQNVLLHFPLLILQISFDVVSLWLLRAPPRKILFGCFCCTLPYIAYSLHLSMFCVQVINCFSYFVFCYILTSYSFKYLPKLFAEVKLLLQSIIFITRTEGVNFLCLKTFKKIFVPVHFLLFWTVTFLTKLYMQFAASTRPEGPNWYYIILSSASAIYISPISLLSTAITVTYLSCFVLSIIKLYLWGTVPNLGNITPSRDHNGWEEGMTTLLLTTITAMTDMNENARMAVLIIISFVVLSSLLQSMLEISEPAILSLNSNQTNNRIHHLKVLLLCAFLFCFPLYVTYVLAQIFPVNFWIAVVLSTSLLISARVLDLVIVHCLFWWDSCQREPWEYLDEVVYFCRSVTKILEFIIAISVVVVGLWEAMYKQTNLVNSSILILHCYFNVWQRINEGLRSFLRRREANRVVNSLRFADAAEIVKCNDLCSICFLEMSEKKSLLVVITQCNHLFHRLCIKKWMSIQNRCPLCTSTISATEVPPPVPPDALLPPPPPTQ